MTIFKKIVCLANSKKLAKRCVAGKEILERSSSGWIRPVSKKTATGEISLDEMSFEGGGYPELLDIVTVPLLEHIPHGYQTENYVVDPDYYWFKNGKMSLSGVKRICDNPRYLWLNGYHSYSGCNDRIPIDMMENRVFSSLLLIEPDEISIIVASEQNRRRIRAEFVFNGELYRFIVTDPVIEEKFILQELGDYDIGRNEVFLCISIGEPFQGFCYKLVAAIIPGI